MRKGDILKLIVGLGALGGGLYLLSTSRKPEAAPPPPEEQPPPPEEEAVVSRYGVVTVYYYPSRNKYVLRGPLYCIMTPWSYDEYAMARDFLIEAAKIIGIPVDRIENLVFDPKRVPIGTNIEELYQKHLEEIKQIVGS